MTKRLGVLTAALLAAGLTAGLCRADEAKADAKAAPEAKADAAKPPEFLDLAKTGKMAAVKFPHKMHADKLKGCAPCHEGEKPLFAKKFDDSVGLKMKDIYKGEACGACHNGVKEVDGKKVFKAMGACVKCHKKAEAEKK